MIIEYFEALERLKNNKPVNVLKGTKITLDAVSLEAGRGKGTIKKSRKVFGKLIEEIENAKIEQSSKKDNSKITIEKYKNLYKKYKNLYKDSLARELMLIDRLEEFEKKTN